MAVVVVLSVDKPVASLQFDLNTSGSVTLRPNIGKSMVSNRLPNGRLRVIVYGLDQTEFSGQFAEVDARLSGPPVNVIGSTPGGTDAGCNVVPISKPAGLRVSPAP